MPGTVKQVRGGGRRSEGIGLTHAHGEGGGVTYRYRGISAPVPGTVKLVRGEAEEMKRSDWRMRKGKTRSVGIDTGSIETDRITFLYFIMSSPSPCACVNPIPSLLLLLPLPVLPYLAPGHRCLVVSVPVCNSFPPHPVLCFAEEAREGETSCSIKSFFHRSFLDAMMI